MRRTRRALDFSVRAVCCWRRRRTAADVLLANIRRQTCCAIAAHLIEQYRANIQYHQPRSRRHGADEDLLQERQRPEPIGDTYRPEN